MAIKKLNPYLNFNGSAAKAIKLYEKALDAKTDNVMPWASAPGQPQTPETKDRIFRTVVGAEWGWRAGAAGFGAFVAARRALLDTFAAHDSLSVQQTLLAMGEAVLTAVPAIDDIRLSLPNQHCLAVDMTKFGMDNRNEIFVVTEEPYGLIEATVRRG